jgi:hypothetical protein
MTISDYMQGIRALHKVHALHGASPTATFTTLLHTVQKETPASSRRKQRNHITPSYTGGVGALLDLNTPHHGHTCLTTSLYVAVTLGEFIIANLDDLDPA